MSKRFCDTDLWNKAWFQDLSLKEKLLLRYIYDRCDSAGVWEVSFRLASFFIGETVTIEDLHNINKRNLQFKFLSDSKVYVVDFIKFQYGKLTTSCKPHLAIIKKLEDYGIDYELSEDTELTTKQMRKRLTAAAKEKILIRDKFECQYCGSKEFLEIDHIVPLIKGGTNEDDNLITACHRCNHIKGDKSVFEFIENNKNKINFLEGVSNILERVSKKFSTLEEKEQEEEQEKGKEIKQEIEKKESSKNFYGEYGNVYLSPKNYDKIKTFVLNDATLTELINELSETIASKSDRYKPYDEKYPDAHFTYLKKFWEFRKNNPAKFMTKADTGGTVNIKSIIDKTIAEGKKKYGLK